METTLTCTICGVEAPRPNANFCFCCGAGPGYLENLPDVPENFKVPADKRASALDHTLARYKDRISNQSAKL